MILSHMISARILAKTDGLATDTRSLSSAAATAGTAQHASHLVASMSGLVRAGALNPPSYLLCGRLAER